MKNMKVVKAEVVGVGMSGVYRIAQPSAEIAEKMKGSAESVVLTYQCGVCGAQTTYPQGHFMTCAG